MDVSVNGQPHEGVPESAKMSDRVWLVNAKRVSLQPTFIADTVRVVLLVALFRITERLAFVGFGPSMFPELPRVPTQFRSWDMRKIGCHV